MLLFLEGSKFQFEIIEYLNNPLTENELSELVAQLNISPIDLVRKNEQIWKDNFKGKTLTDKEIIAAMVKFPKLIERPIVVNNNKAVIARPTELIKSIL